LASADTILRPVEIRVISQRPLVANIFLISCNVEVNVADEKKLKNGKTEFDISTQIYFPSLKIIKK
jgi:hypothetical protein